MTDNANSTITDEQAAPDSGLTSTWELDGKTYPLFPFDQPCEIKLRNGTIHRFKPWNEQAEKRREDLLKSVIVTSPAVINGENPRDVKTDFTKSMLAYYDMMIDEIGGLEMEYEGFKITSDQFIKADRLIGANGRGQIKLKDLLPVSVRKAAGSRLYTGKIEIEKPDVEDEEIDFDPFNIDDIDISKTIEIAERKRSVYVLSMDRDIVARQELGIELLKNGQLTDPTHVMRYHFNEPDGSDFSTWEMKSARGFAINLQKGGMRAERFYNLNTIRSLFDKLIRSIEGASLDGKPVALPEDEKQREAVLARVPLQIKKQTMVALFTEAENLGND